MQLRDKYRVYEHEAATHYEKIAEEMRTRVKKQIKEQESIHNKLRWDIEQNNLLITFLQSRLEEAQKRIVEKEQEMEVKVNDQEVEFEEFKRKTEEEKERLIQETIDKRREVSIDCPLGREEVSELLDKLE